MGIKSFLHRAIRAAVGSVVCRRPVVGRASSSKYRRLSIEPLESRVMLSNGLLPPVAPQTPDPAIVQLMASLPEAKSGDPQEPAPPPFSMVGQSEAFTVPGAIGPRRPRGS